MALQRGYGAIIGTIIILAVLWETKDQAVPVTKEEWYTLVLDWVTPWRDVMMEYSIQWRATFQDVVQSAFPLAGALWKLVYMMVWPIVWGLYTLLIKAAYGFYDFVVIRLICSETTLRHVRYGVQTAIQWQMARSKRELAMEVAAISFLLASYLLLRFLNRKRYLDRCKAWARRKQSKVKRQYKAFVQNLAAVNRQLAIMIPHLLFFGGMILFEILCAPTLRYLFSSIEITALTWMLSTVKPCILSSLLVFKVWQEQQQQQQQPKRKRKSKGRQSVFVDQNDSNAEFFKDLDPTSLLHYLVVRGTIAAAKKAFLLFPFTIRFLASQTLVSSLLCKAEFWFWAWVNVSHYITPTFLYEYHHQTPRNPIDWLVDQVIKPVAMEIEPGLTLDFSNVKVFWNSTVVVATKFGLQALVFSSILSPVRAEQLLHLTEEARAVVAPFLLVLIYPLRGFGVLGASHILPIVLSLRAKVTPTEESPRTVYHWLQTWVLHILLTALLWLFETPLYFVPFSNILTFGAFAVLSLCSPTMMDSIIYRMFQEELQIWHILPPGEMKDKPSLVGNAVLWILDKLPKASDCIPINGQTQNQAEETNRNDLGGEDPHEGAFRSSNGSPREILAETVVPEQRAISEKENDYPARHLRKRRVRNP